MNFTLSSLIAFAAGATIGSLVAWRISKKRYEDLMQKETEELREYYTGKLERLEGDLDEYINEWNEAEEAYENELKKHGYTKSEASLAVGRLDQTLSAEELIKQALKTLARRI